MKDPVPPSPYKTPPKKINLQSRTANSAGCDPREPTEKETRMIYMFCGTEVRILRLYDDYALCEDNEGIYYEIPLNQLEKPEEALA